MLKEINLVVLINRELSFDHDGLPCVGWQTDQRMIFALILLCDPPNRPHVECGGLHLMLVLEPRNKLFSKSLQLPPWDMKKGTISHKSTYIIGDLWNNVFCISQPNGSSLSGTELCRNQWLQINTCQQKWNSALLLLVSSASSSFNSKKTRGRLESFAETHRTFHRITDRTLPFFCLCC